MSMIGVAMDLLLGLLLVAALVVGLRVERRLRHLRETQAGFAGAVNELNTAIAMAENGLSELRAATTESQTTLTDRIHDARAAAARLEAQTAAAARDVQRLEEVMERASKVRLEAPPPAPTPAQVNGPVPLHHALQAEIERRWGPSALRAPAPAASRFDDEEPLVLRPAALARRAAEPEPSRREPVRPPVEPARNPRSRARVDDDLFEPVRASGASR